MSRLRELIDELCPDGVEYRALGEVGAFTKGRGLQKKDFSETGVGCIHYGQIYTRLGIVAIEPLTYVSPEKAPGFTWVKPNDIVIAVTSENVDDVCKAVVWRGKDRIVTGAHAVVFHPFIDSMYVAYYLQTHCFNQQKIMIVDGVKVIEMKIDRLAKVRIPVPPIEVQREIVRILDSFQELDDALTAEIEAREKQLQSVLTYLDVNDANVSQAKPFKECCKIGRGTYITKKDVREGDVPVVMGGLAPAYYHSEFNHEGEAIVISRSGVNAGFSSFWNQAIFVSDGFVADGNGIDVLKYVYYALHARQRNVDMLRRGSGVPHVNGKMLGDLLLFIPSVEEQSNWVTKCDAISDLTIALRSEREARRKQFAYYRDKLLAFPELNKEVDK